MLLAVRYISFQEVIRKISYKIFYYNELNKVPNRMANNELTTQNTVVRDFYS